MSQINPFAGSIVQASSVQRQQATDREQKAQRNIDKRKDSGATGDRFEHSIESSEELTPIHDEQKDGHQQHGVLSVDGHCRGAGPGGNQFDHHDYVDGLGQHEPGRHP